jgi:hypothetical protein
MRVEELQLCKRARQSKHIFIKYIALHASEINTNFRCSWLCITLNGIVYNIMHVVLNIFLKNGCFVGDIYSVELRAYVYVI